MNIEYTLSCNFQTVTFPFARAGRFREDIVEKHSFFTVPGTNIQILAAVEDLNFFDTQSVHLRNPISPLDAWRIVMSRPMPILKFAFRVRDCISSMFGVKKIAGFSGGVPKAVEVGQMLDFFLVEYFSQNVLTLTVRDRHLDVMTCISLFDNTLTITSSVKSHNAFGRAYMIPVGPVHKLIVRKDLRQIDRAVV